ncbi:AbrB family transcriptional regulator [Bacillus sp. V3B]|nr:AbrB family transcriptional regulator [Bacillus sp. V3B]MCQ6276303.1 AbrB family transcriptional regulator [Bacillus sp. V3B]
MIVSSIGGFLLSLTGLGIGWMIGTIVLAAFLSFRQPVWLKITTESNGLPSYWLKIGQWLLAIELGRQMNLSVLETFSDHWLTITIMLFLSIIFSLLSGVVLWKCSRTDMLTSFFATAPGGIATMPGIAEEVGANTATVSIVQTLRVFLVVLTIPIIASSWLISSVDQVVTSLPSTSENSEFQWSQLLGTVVLGLTAWGGYYVGKLLKFPAPILVGGMVCVAFVQSFTSFFIGSDLVVWWPHSIMILSQICIAASIGSRFQRSMFIGIKKTVVVAFLSTIALILAMFGCAYLVSETTGISLVTSVLAFAPGGVAEMATTAVVLNADSTFVVTVQVLRIVVVILVLPPFFRLLNRWELRKRTHSDVSA